MPEEPEAPGDEQPTPDESEDAEAIGAATSEARLRRVDALRQVAHTRADAASNRLPVTSVAPVAAEPTPPERTRRRPVALTIFAVVIVAGLVAGGVAAATRVLGRAPSAPASVAQATVAATGVVRSFRDFAVPTPNAKPFDIARGPDGAMWFTEFDGNKIGRITPNGVFSEYPVPTAGAAPYLLAASSAGALWFSEYYGNAIGRITPNGTITEFPLTDPNSSATGVAAAPDGSLWVAAYPAEIYHVTPYGVMTRFNLPTPSPVPFALAVGGDGAVWFTYDAEFTSQDPSGDSRIGRITPAGAVSEFALPTPGANVDDIAAGPDGALWFTDFANDLIGSISPGGAIHEYPAGSPYTALNALAVGPDGAMWFTRQDGVVGRITSSGGITTFTFPTANSQPDGIAAGPGDTLWIAETGANRIGCLTLQ